MLSGSPHGNSMSRLTEAAWTLCVTPEMDGNRRMLPYLCLRAWPYAGWWMPAGTTGVSTFWLSLLLVGLCERPQGLPQTIYFGKEDWIVRMQVRRSSWLKPHWLKLPLWFEHSLASLFGGLGAVALIHQGVATTRFSTKPGSDLRAALLVFGLASDCAYRCIAWASVLH